MKYLFLSIAVTICGCASNTIENIDFKEWYPIGYEGFLESINLSSGSNVENCGFHDLMTEEGKKSVEYGYKCARQNANAGKPFKFGTVRLPIDSFAFEILIGTADSEYWLVVYDVMIDGDAPQQWAKKCNSIKFSRKNQDYEGKRCGEINSEVWP